jgi:hypothetical protein
MPGHADVGLHEECKHLSSASFFRGFVPWNESPEQRTVLEIVPGHGFVFLISTTFNWEDSDVSTNPFGFSDLPVLQVLLQTV